MFWDSIKKAIADLFKSSGFRTWLLTALVPLIITFLAKLFPFLALPGVGWIVAWAVGRGVEFLYLLAQMKAIDLKTDDEVRRYNETIGELRALLENPGATKEQIREATEKAKARIDELLDFGR